MSSFDRSSSSSEDEFFDACSGDEKSCEETDGSSVTGNEENSPLCQQTQAIQPQSTSALKPAAVAANDSELFNQPKAPPRKRKIKKVNSFSKTGDQVQRDYLTIDSNITSYVNDIASIQGDLSVTDAYVSDRRSVHVDDLKRKDISDDLINKVVEENRLREIAQQQLARTPKESGEKGFFRADERCNRPDALGKSEPPIAGKSVIAETIREDDEQSVDSNSKCINPINLHLLKITNDYEDSDDEETVEDDERSSQVTEKISDANFESLQDDLPASKREPLKNTVKNLKKFGQGFMKGVQKVKNSASSASSGGQAKVAAATAAEPTVERSKLNQYQYEQELLAQQNQFKFKSNRKKEPPDFEGLKIIQELNDCKGAIWCMKWSICGKLLAVAGKDQLLRVYCCYSAWKYFTQMRSNASSTGGNQISPNSTKERSFSGSRHSISSLNNDNLSFESVMHSQSFSKFMNEDNVLSEEGPLLLFSAYNGHKADVRIDLVFFVRIIVCPF